MEMASVAYSASTEEWFVRGDERRCGIDGQLILNREDLPQVRAVDLKSALAAYCHNYGNNSGEADVSELPEEHFDADAGGSPIGFVFHGGELLVSVMNFGEWPDDADEDAHRKRLSQLVGPLLRNMGAVLHSIDVEDSWSGPLVLATRLRLRVPWRGRCLDRLFAVGESVLRLCDAIEAGTVTRDAVADLLRGGRAELLVGQP